MWRPIRARNTRIMQHKPAVKPSTPRMTASRKGKAVRQAPWLGDTFTVRSLNHIGRHQRAVLICFCQLIYIPPEPSTSCCDDLARQQSAAREILACVSLASSLDHQPSCTCEGYPLGRRMHLSIQPHHNVLTPETSLHNVMQIH